MANTENIFLGRSFKYPFQPDTKAQIAIVDGRESIRQSIGSILGTPKGTRYFLREYGSDIHLLKFEPNDDILRSLLVTLSADAIFIWEKRVRLLSVAFQDDEENPKVDQINMQIKYEILGSNEIDSFIFPFYREIAA